MQDWPVFSGYTSHFEGWGLYSEFLGLEMGMFENPYHKIGFYSGSLLRAARLVVDTGLHAFGWSRNRAIEYLLDNTGFPKPMIESQIDRQVSISDFRTKTFLENTNIYNFNILPGI